MRRPHPTNTVDLSRREFLHDAALKSIAAAGSAGGLLLPHLAFAQDNAGPVDCGPPPRAVPQNRTAGESFPPLPLPATPLRRSERKRPPSPPALIGKAALGPTRWVVRNGQRTQYRDWMTDPSDVDSLLHWTNQQLGINYRKTETDFTQFSFDPRELPALLFAGHNNFELPAPVRQRLARYLLDGGMIIGDACCGWENFNESFRHEMAAIFPDRPLRHLEADDPMLAAYYRLGNFQYQRADGSRYSAESCLEGIMVGCRLAVVYSPVDLTCGWDGHDHPRGKRVVIDQSRHIGANYITYLLGSYQLGRFLSTTPVYFQANEPDRDAFVFAQLQHEGDWDPDPSAVHNLLRHVRANSTLNVRFRRATARPGDVQALNYPLLYITGHYNFTWTEQQVGWMRRYLTAGGMLLADACCGRLAFYRAFEREMARVLPDHRLQDLPLDHPIYSIPCSIRNVDYTPRVAEDFANLRTPSLKGVTLNGRLAVVYSRFDLGNGWEQFPHPYSYGYSDRDALAIGTNVVVYAVTH
jgi:hypothetical protein